MLICLLAKLLNCNRYNYIAKPPRVNVNNLIHSVCKMGFACYKVLKLNFADIATVTET